MQWVTQWMEKNCRVNFVTVKDEGEGGNMSNALSEFTKFVSDQYGSAGKTVFFGRILMVF